MSQSLVLSNPFALLVEPEAVFLEIERSERLQRLKSRIFRPLDKPLIPKVEDESASHDAEIEAAAIDEEQVEQTDAIDTVM